MITLAIVVILTNGIEAMTGFGSTILAVAICVSFIPLEFLVPVLILVNLVLSSYIVIRHRQHIALSFLFRQILPLVGIGAALGSYFFNHLSEESGFIKFFFGLFIVLLSLFELFQLVRNAQLLGKNKRVAHYKTFFWLLGGGIMQGLYASGGPMVVYLSSQKGLNKQSFRATLSALWLIVNLLLVIYYAFNGILTKDVFKTGLILIPCVVVGIILGENLHKRVDEQYFKIVTYVLLIFAGVALMVGR